LPDDPTLTEKALTLVGWAGSALGVLIMAAAVGLTLLAGWYPAFGAYLFLLGALGVVVGLVMSAIAQALASLRVIASRTQTLEVGQ
jgi:Zn-dependent protease with chaperone function